MKTRTLAAAAALMLFAAPAYAFYCPNTVKAIDTALAKATLSADQIAQVKKSRDQGEAQHKAGDHKAAVKSLAQATRTILNNM